MLYHAKVRREMLSLYWVYSKSLHHITFIHIAFFRTIFQNLFWNFSKKFGSEWSDISNDFRIDVL